MAPTSTSTTTTAAALADLGVAIAADGAAAHHGELVALAAHARRRGVGGAAVDVMADPAAPPVVRDRAFATVAAAIVRQPAPQPRRAAARVSRRWEERRRPQPAAESHPAVRAALLARPALR